MHPIWSNFPFEMGLLDALIQANTPMCNPRRTQEWDSQVFRPLAIARLAAVILALIQSASAAQLVAHWKGGFGDWYDATNWEITENGSPHSSSVPNNTASDTYDVIIDTADATAEFRAPGNVTVRNLTLNASAQNGIDGIAGSSALTITGNFNWRAGAVSLRPLNLQGETTVSTATLADRFQGEINFAGHTIVRSGAALRIAEYSISRNAAGALFEFEDGATLIAGNASKGDFSPGDGMVQLENFGTLRVLPGAVPFEPVGWVTLVNSGTLEFPGKTVSIPLGLQQLSGSTYFGGTFFQSVHGGLDIQGGLLFGIGSIEVNGISIAGTLKGSFDARQTPGAFFQEGSVLQLELRGPNNYDTFKIGSLQLAGNLQVSLSSAFASSIQASDSFTMITSANTINGRFANVALGERLAISNGTGSLSISQTGLNSGTIVLSDYGQDPLRLNLSAGPVLLPLNTHGDGVPLDPAATLTAVNTLSWDGARLQVRIAQGFQSDEDSLGVLLTFPYQRNSGLILLLPEVPGDATELATVNSAAEGIDITFNANAATQNVEDILKALFYANSQFNTEWFEQWDDVEPVRKIEVDLITTLGTRRAQTEVHFPELVGITYEAPASPACSGTAGLMKVIGIFSDGTSAPVPQLSVTFSSDSADVVVSAVRGAPGNASLVFPSIESGHGEVTAKAGSFQTQASYSVFDCGLAGNGAALFNPSCVADYIYEFFCLPGSACDNEKQCGLPVCNVTPPPMLPPLPFIRAANVEATFTAVPLRTLRFLMATTPEGSAWIRLYEKHSPEVVRLVSTDSALRTNILRVFASFQPAVAALLQGKGATVQIEQSAIDNLNGVWTNLAHRASPELKAVLNQQRDRFQNFQAFVGTDFAQWAGLLQIASPAQPLIYASRSLRQEGQFTIEANDVPSLDFSLWRSPEIRPLNWQKVLSAEVSHNGYAIVLRDTNAPSDRLFYQIRAEPKLQLSAGSR
jgi:hypothetical protein